MTTALEGGEWSQQHGPDRNLPPGKTRYPFYRRLGGPRAGLDTRKISSHRNSIPDRPASSQSLYRLSYPAHSKQCTNIKCPRQTKRNSELIVPLQIQGCTIYYEVNKWNWIKVPTVQGAVSEMYVTTSGSVYSLHGAESFLRRKPVLS